MKLKKFFELFLLSDIGIEGRVQHEKPSSSISNLRQKTRQRLVRSASHWLKMRNMVWWCVVFPLMYGPYAVTDATCTIPSKFFIDCGIMRTISSATQFCLGHSMTLINLTNSSGTLAYDLAALNQSILLQNCTGSFWFSTEDYTGLTIDVARLGDLAVSLLTGAINFILCLVGLICPGSTTTAPITNAFTVCTRPAQPAVIQKCSSQNIQSDIQKFRFKAQNMPAGILDSFPSRSPMACGAVCSTDETCVGIFYDKGVCNLYM